MTTVKVKNIRKNKGSNEDEPWYEWDIESNGKLVTFYTDQKGENIWQQGVEFTKNHIYSTALDHFKRYRINIDASVEDIEKQLQDFADKSFFDKYLK